MARRSMEWILARRDSRKEKGGAPEKGAPPLHSRAGSDGLLLGGRGDLAGPRGLDLHLDLPRLGLRPLGQHDAQHAVPALGRDVLGVDRAVQREAAAERAVGPLDAVVRFALL